MNNIFEIMNNIVLFILGVATIVGILDYVGFLPEKARKILKLNRSDETLQLLSSLGIDTDKLRRINEKYKYPDRFMGEHEKIPQIVKEELEKYVIKKNLSIGRQRILSMSKYYDLIGASCDPGVATYYAQILSSYWANCLDKGDVIKNEHFDFVVTPKGGSPILGYEFAKLVNKPFILHEESERLHGIEDDMRTKFDCVEIPERGKTALIVDDSTTGGRMVSDTIDDLLKYGYVVNTCLVVFEPYGKNARGRIAQKNVQLLSIVETNKS